MIIKDFKQCPEIIAGDNSILREILSPTRDDLAINYSIAHAKVKPGETTHLHKLKSAEVYYILEGEGEIFIDDEQAKVAANQAIYIPPKANQKIKNTGQTDLVFLCIVDPAWRPEDEEVIK